MDNGNGKLPYMPFYLNDFFSDDKVVVMDRAQIGSYLCLLHAAWQQEQPGTLPDDDELLAKWAKCESLDWAVEKGTIMGPFKKVNGIWCQKRMMAEALKAKRLHTLRVEAGQKGGASKARRLLKPSCSEALARASDSGYISGSGSPSSEEESERKPNGVEFHPPKTGQARSYEEFRNFVVQHLRLPESDARWAWDHFQGNGWTNDGKPMIKWQSVLSSWERKKQCFPSFELLNRGKR